MRYGKAINQQSRIAIAARMKPDMGRMVDMRITWLVFESGFWTRRRRGRPRAGYEEEQTGTYNEWMNKSNEKQGKESL